MLAARRFGAKRASEFCPSVILRWRRVLVDRLETERSKILGTSRNRRSRAADGSVPALPSRHPSRILPPSVKNLKCEILEVV
eukprot:6404302-Pyramimonas_sp.AAC.1